jgi:hypothetical protein
MEGRIELLADPPAAYAVLIGGQTVATFGRGPSRCLDENAVLALLHTLEPPARAHELDAVLLGVKTGHVPQPLLEAMAKMRRLSMSYLKAFEAVWDHRLETARRGDTPPVTIIREIV